MTPTDRSMISDLEAYYTTVLYGPEVKNDLTPAVREVAALLRYASCGSCPNLSASLKATALNIHTRGGARHEALAYDLLGISQGLRCPIGFGMFFILHEELNLDILA